MEKQVQPETTQANNDNGFEIQSIETGSINLPAATLRRDFDDLGDLKKSIERDGLQEPILAYRDKKGNVVIIDGVCRFKVLRELGIPEILCLIKQGTITPRDAERLAYVKNAERKTLSVIEKALHIKRMRTTHKFTLRQMEVMGYGSSPTISNYLKLLELSDGVQQAVHDGRISMAHGIQLARLETPGEQERTADQVIRDNLSASQTADHISRYMQKLHTVALADDDPEIETSESAYNPCLQNVYLKDGADMSELPSGSVHLVVAGPDRLIRNEFTQTPSSSEYWNGIRPVVEECSRVLVSGGFAALVMPDNVDIPYKEEQSPIIQPACHKYQSFFKKNGVKLIGQIVWDTGCLDSRLLPKSKKEFGEIYHAEYPIRNHHRFINIFRKNGDRAHPSNQDMIQMRISEEDWSQWTRSLWAIEAEDGNPDVFPEELVRRLILMFTYEGETVLDPFLGTGTTIKVARELNREAFGYERDLKLQSVLLDKIGDTHETMAGFVGKAMGEVESQASDDEDDILLETVDDQEAEEAIAMTMEAGAEV